MIVDMPFNEKVSYKMVIEVEYLGLSSVSFYSILDGKKSQRIIVCMEREIFFKNTKIMNQLVNTQEFFIDNLEIERLKNLIKILKDKEILKKSFIYFLGM